MGEDGAKRLRENLVAEGRSISDDELQRLQAFVESDDYTVSMDHNWRRRSPSSLMDKRPTTAADVTDFRDTEHDADHSAQSASLVGFSA